MKIIGRKEEIRELERCARSMKSELICVYGRRRVGKTFLVEQFFGNRFSFRATGVEGGKTRAQLKSFHQRLKAHGDLSGRIPADWFEAFSRLEAVLNSETAHRSPHGKIAVFFDDIERDDEIKYTDRPFSYKTISLTTRPNTNNLIITI